MLDKKIVGNKSALFALTEAKCHHLKVAPDSDEYLKVWIKEPTWLEVETALTSVMKIDARNQNFDIDLNAMYRFMVDNFITKTEPSLSTLDLLRLSPYIGTQLKEVLPNPFDAFMEDEAKNDA